MRASVNAVAGVLIVTTPLAAHVPSVAYDQGVAARHAGDNARAVVLLEQAVRENPKSSDALVQYGYALLAQHRLHEADKAFGDALRLAPTYEDARVGRALVAERLGATVRASALVALVTTSNADANALRHRLASAGTNTHWALDLDAGPTRVGSGQRDWRELEVQLSYRSDKGARLAGRIEASRRFDRSDIYAEIRAEVPRGAGSSVYVIAGATPSADFRPRWQLGAGGRTRIRSTTEPTVLTLDARHAYYRSGPVTLVNPGLEQYFAGGRAWITVQSINVVSGKLLSGALARADAFASVRLRFFAGIANGPDLENGIVSRTRDLFVGAALEATPAVAVRISAFRDRPTSGANRTGLNLGTTVHF